MLDPTKLEAYNKTINTASPGTLIANWYEERELRQVHNASRNIQMIHIHKNRNDLFLLPPDELKLNDPNIYVSTAERILGEKYFL